MTNEGFWTLVYIAIGGGFVLFIQYIYYEFFEFKRKKRVDQRKSPNTPTQAQVNAYRENLREITERERYLLDEYLGKTKFIEFLKEANEIKNDAN